MKVSARIENNKRKVNGRCANQFAQENRYWINNYDNHFYS